MLSPLFVGLVAVPLLGALAYAITGQTQHPRIRTLRPTITLVAALVTLLLSAALFAAPGEAVVGGWSPVSVMGAPLLIADAPKVAGVIFALACVELARAVYGAGETRASLVAHALTFGALALTALANNTLTLFIGLGMTDLFATVAAVIAAPHPAARRDVLRGAVLLAASLLMLGAALALNMVTESSLYFPLMSISARAVPLLAAALVLRFALLPIYPHAAANRASQVASMLLIMRLAALNVTPFPFALAPLAVLGALIALERATATYTAELRTMGAQVGALMLALTPATTNDPAVVCAMTSAWILGASLIEHPARAARMIGALSLYGIPPLLGFVARMGVAPDFAADGRWIVLAAWVLGLILLAYTLARVVRGHPLERGWVERNWRSWVSWIALALPLLAGGLFGPALGLAGMADMAQANGALGWLVMAAALVAGVAMMALEPRWANRFRPLRERLERAFSLRWFSELLEGAIRRLGVPFRGVFVFLESDGALVWAIIAVLIAVLVARPGGP